MRVELWVGVKETVTVEVGVAVYEKVLVWVAVNDWVTVEV